MNESSSTIVKISYIGIGSNIGDKLFNCLKAIELIKRIPGCRIMAQSDFYRTEPVGVEGQEWYLNGVISLSISISARELLQSFLDIETCMGRKRKGKWDPRIIDLDILLFGDDIINEEDLIIPHPRMYERRFVLEPLARLAPDLIHPLLGKSMAGLLAGLSEQGQAVLRTTGK